MKLLHIDKFRKESGHCWIASLPPSLASGDSTSSMASVLLLFEGDTELGPAHASHDRIRELGRGAFSHWGTDLFFSTSDNSSPARNGRGYWIVAAAWDEPARADKSANGVSPVNYGLLTAPPPQALEAAKYALKIAQSYVNSLP